MTQRPGSMRPSVPRELFTGFRERRTTRMRIVALLPLAGRPLVALAVLVQVVAGLLPVGFILATAAVIAGVPETVAAGLDSPQWRHLQDLLVLAAASFFGTQLLLPLQEYLGELVRRRIDDRMRDRLLSASFAGGGVAVLEDSELRDEAADAANLLRVAMWTPGAACAGQLALVSRYLQTIAPAVVVSIAYAWSAGPALLAAALIIRFGYRLGLAAFGKVFRSTHQSRRRSWYFRDLLLGSVAAKEVRVFGLLPWVSQRYAEAALDGVRPVWQSRRRLFHGPYVLYTLAAFVLLGAVFTGAARASAAGLLGIGALMLVLQSGMSAMRIGGFIAESDVQTEYGMLAYRALERFEEITAAAARTGAGEGRDPAGLPVTELRFENVTFGYPGGEPVLDGLDLRIPAGRSLAVVGLNGAGKTTLVKLLARLYEPTGGRITADGVDIRSFPVSVWQRRIAAIFQDFVHFELSVRENVGFGAVELLDDPERGDKAVTAALDRVGATGFVRRLPGGLDTPLSRQYTGGTDLSGGQWQRIAIARALMAVEGGAGVLVLDEPTANLDVRAEVAFFDRFLALTRGVTSLVISHRFSTVRRADRIVVLEHGRVLEDGTHDELLALGGRYAELFRLQASRFEGSRA